MDIYILIEGFDDKCLETTLYYAKAPLVDYILENFELSDSEVMWLVRWSNTTDYCGFDPSDGRIYRPGPGHDGYAITVQSI